MSDVQPVAESLGQINVNDEVKQEDLQPEPKPTSFPVTCLTKEKTEVVVPSHILSQSKTFMDMCASFGVISENKELDQAFPGQFPVNMPEKVFLKVVDWCEHHVGVPNPVIQLDPQTTERIHFTFTEFERGFLNVGKDELEELVMAANFLDIYSLYILACQMFAELTIGKSHDEVRELFDMEDDMTKEEIEACRKEYSSLIDVKIP